MHRIGRVLLGVMVAGQVFLTMPDARATACDGVAITTDDDPQAVVDAQPPGTRFCLESGIHRGFSVQPRDGDRFTGEPGTVLSGARVLTEFVQEGDVWWVGGQSQEGQVHGDCTPSAPRCDRPEDLFLDRELLLHVTSVEALGPGRWWFDYAADRIYLGNDPEGRIVETSVTRHAFHGNAAGIEISNLTVEMYANPAQSGAVMAGEGPGGDAEPRDGWIITGVTAQLNHGAGIAFDRTIGTRIVASRADFNGQIGIAGTGEATLIEGNEIAGNNTAGFLWEWEAGGTKFALHNGLTVRGNRVHNNAGPGLWSDIDNRDVLYEENEVWDNAAAGIFHEISFNAVIRNNRLSGNGLIDHGWCYGAGIQISMSSDVQVTGNVLIDNARSIVGISQDRGEPYRLANLVVRDNLSVTTDLVGESVTGICDDAGNDVFSAASGNRFEENEYRGRGQAWWWDGAEMDDFDDWQATGNDASGSWQARLTDERGE